MFASHIPFGVIKLGNPQSKRRFMAGINGRFPENHVWLTEGTKWILATCILISKYPGKWQGAFRCQTYQTYTFGRTGSRCCSNDCGLKFQTKMKTVVLAIFVSKPPIFWFRFRVLNYSTHGSMGWLKGKPQFSQQYRFVPPHVPSHYSRVVWKHCLCWG
jgi:hypothetical protein